MTEPKLHCFPLSSDFLSLDLWLVQSALLGVTLSRWCTSRLHFSSKNCHNKVYAALNQGIPLLLVSAWACLFNSCKLEDLYLGASGHTCNLNDNNLDFILQRDVILLSMKNVMSKKSWQFVVSTKIVLWHLQLPDEIMALQISFLPQQIKYLENW